MKILISGASGFVGGALLRSLRAEGHEVVCLRRATLGGENAHDSDNSGVEARWDIEAGRIDLGGHQEIDCVVHLAGENVAEGRWTQKKKARILNSRVRGTRLLAEYFSQAAHKPTVIISCSGIGYYGDQGDQILTEASKQGDGFLADVCGQWEHACAAALGAGIRVVNLRLGMILGAVENDSAQSAVGGALKKMLLPFTFGLGGRIGNGQQYMSWLSMNDLSGIVNHLITNDDMRGPVNAVSPTALSNAAFTKILGRQLRRPTFLPLPAWVARLMFGEMAQALLLCSARVVPQVLEESGYAFTDADLDSTLRSLL